MNEPRANWLTQVHQENYRKTGNDGGADSEAEYSTIVFKCPDHGTG